MKSISEVSESSDAVEKEPVTESEATESTVSLEAIVSVSEDEDATVETTFEPDLPITEPEEIVEDNDEQELPDE